MRFSPLSPGPNPARHTLGGSYRREVIPNLSMPFNFRVNSGRCGPLFLTGLEPSPWTSDGYARVAIVRRIEISYFCPRAVSKDPMFWWP